MKTNEVRLIDANALIKRKDVLEILEQEFNMSAEERSETDDEKEMSFNAGEMHCARRVTSKVKELPEMTLTLNTLRDEVYQDAVAHGLWNEEYDIIGCTNVVEEEFLELEHAADDVQFARVCFDDDNEALQFYVEELADVIIASLSVAGKLGIDIDAAIRRKMEINKERPWKHGKEEKK